jgi:hypothetical protein
VEISAVISSYVGEIGQASPHAFEAMQNLKRALQIGSTSKRSALIMTPATLPTDHDILRVTD